jgi:type I site-specific restriction endonuclease
VAKATKTATATVVEETDGDIEELDEVEATAEAAAEAAPAKAKKPKKEKPVRTGKSTKDAAAELGITPVRLRRILRSEDGGFADKEYTKYDLSDDTIAHIRELLASGQAEKAARPKKSKKAAATEDAAEEVGEELSDLEDTADEDTEELDLDLDEEEDEEEEE